MEKHEGVPIGGSDALHFNAEGERILFRTGGSRRFALFSIKAPSVSGDKPRAPLSLALVIDRSGSMSGEKILMAKSAALKVIDRLDESDRASVTIFDNEIEVILPMAPVTEQFKAQARSGLARIDARSNTALHEGWLTGCRSIAPGGGETQGDRISRCFLLTDGRANEGLTDPEQIARQAGDVRKHTGICTSTFGIGSDYNEELLGPMAVAGSGQFHHLRDPHEIEAAFAGELSDLFNIAAKNVRVELELSSIRKAELISLYWVDPSMDGQRFVVDVGDLIAGEERRLVVRLHIPKAAEGTKIAVRARILMDADGSSYTSPWKTMDFEAASENACDEEKRNMQVMHWVGLHYAEKAKKEALDSNRRGDLAAALYRLETAIAKISVYAEGDGDLMKAIADLRGMHADLKEGALDAEAVHEASYTTQRISRGQRDHRNFESH